NIRKFRQTIRDSWERQVSAVYPEAKAEFDTTAIRLYPSPAPLERRPIRLVSISDMPPEAVDPSGGATPTEDRFLISLRAAIGESNARHWLSDAVLETTED